ncbi:hypothetical protein ONZ51_g2396 [Trametes cubensis]|uniref:Glucose receptor Git3 N-terminal domain-containing protein n=1 Tax=Trametes cubensis TaxID=1111947 RepID=A0AAD7U0E8_9APHY|nr:hypothetical protein ONZ51_g2396 [Trametes cubensis]
MNSSTYDDTLATLLDGDAFVLRRPYTASEATGVLVLALISCVSATAVVGLLLAIAVSAYNTRHSTSRNLFVRSHVAAYFISMLICEVMQSILKHLSDVGTAYWSLIIAMNTFWILFLRWKLRRFVLVGALVGGWCAIGAIVSAGPAAIQKVERGPFYAISGYWCWIQDEYPAERITLDYMIMFISALLSFSMYILVFLRLRGNVMLHGWRLSFRFRNGPSDSAAPRSVDTHAVNIAKGMLLYPLAYTILLLPIALARFAEWSGSTVPFAVTVVWCALWCTLGDPVSQPQSHDLTGFVNVRESTLTSSSAFTDIEKLVYEDNMLSRTTTTESRTITAVAPAHYSETPGYYSPGKAAEGYDQLSLNSAAATQSRPVSWNGAVLTPPSPAAPFRGPRVSSESPTITVAIPSSRFNPFADDQDRTSGN